MTERPTFHPELGAFIEALREKKEWGLREAALYAQNRGLKVLTKSQIDSLEKGRVKNPNPEALQALADLYDVPYKDIATRFVEKRYGVGQTATTEAAAANRHSVDTTTGADGGYPQISVDDPRFLAALSDACALASAGCRRDGALKGILAEMAFAFAHTADGQRMVRPARRGNLQKKASQRLGNQQRRGKRNVG